MQLLVEFIIWNYIGRTHHVCLPAVSLLANTPSSMVQMGTEEDEGDPPVTLLDFEEKSEPAQCSSTRAR